MFLYFNEAKLRIVDQGFTFMVDFHLSHPFLQTVLPTLCNFLIHDKVEQVRIAIIDLLLKVKTLRAIKVSASILQYLLTSLVAVHLFQQLTLRYIC